jgi:glucokinase
LVTLQGDILVETQFPTSQSADPAIFVTEVIAEIEKLQTNVGEEVQIIAFGIGAPNGNYYNGTIEFAPNLAWKGIVPLAQLFIEKLGIPVILTNDANAAALGEMLFGAAQGEKDFIEITIGTGLGSGIVSKGELILGHDGFAGEIGHVIAVRNGRMCTCGRAGCLETYVSARGLIWTAEELAPQFPDSTLSEEIQQKTLTAKKVQLAAQEGDALAKHTYAYTGQILGEMLANSVAYTSPKVFYFFGGVAKAGEILLEPARKAMEENLLVIFKGKVRLEMSALNSRNAAVLGAAALAWKEIAV